MSFLNISIVVLASMVIVLAGMVGYLYFQQARVLHSVNSLGALVASMYVPDEDSEEEEDDRASVEKEPEVEVVNAPDTKKPIVEEEESAPASDDHVDTDELQDKTAAELKEMLTKKGIPFGKRDAKTVLIQLLKATA